MDLPEGVKLALAVLVLALMGLGVAARRYPSVEWLRAFDLQRRLSEDQRTRLRRSANTTAGAQLILLGIVVMLGFFALKVMFLSSIERSELIIVGVVAATCIGLGTVAIVRNR